MELHDDLLDIIESLPDATFAIDLQGRVIAWNREMEAMSGVKAHDMLLKGDYEYAVPFYYCRRPILIDLVLCPNEEIEKKYTVLTKTKDLLICESEMTDREGNRRVLWAKARPFHDANGDIIGAIEIVRDITEQKRLLRELEVREQELQRKSRYLEEANVALKVLLERRERDKSDLQDDVIVNVQQLVLPYVARLRKTRLTPEQVAFLDVLEANLSAIISPFVRNATARGRNLTPREIEIAKLIRQGRKTKQIAELLNLSPRSIDFHRANLRKKIGVQTTRANLYCALSAFEP
jgi:DNA-binding CsgD family transcriptional regulator